MLITVTHEFALRYCLIVQLINKRMYPKLKHKIARYALMLTFEEKSIIVLSAEPQSLCSVAKVLF